MSAPDNGQPRRKEPAVQLLDGGQRTFLARLLDTPAPSGFEQPAAELWRTYAQSFAEVEVDGIGNSYARVNSGAGPVVALVGHIDEIGFIVTKIEKSGLLRFQEIGGWDKAVPVGQRVRVLSQDDAGLGTLRRGIISRQSAHQLSEEAESNVKLSDLWIEIGAADEDEARAVVRVGDPVVLDAVPEFFDNGRVMSRSLDNRISAFIALEAARRCEGVGAEVVAVASTREEISGAGAATSSFRLQPDVACVLDVTPGTDVPGADDEEDARLGAGPAVLFGAATSHRVSRELLRAGEGLGFNVQVTAAGRNTSTDTEDVVRAGRGVPAGLLQVPCRNLHSPGEVLDLADVTQTIDLLVAWIQSRADATGQ